MHHGADFPHRLSACIKLAEAKAACIEAGDLVARSRSPASRTEIPYRASENSAPWFKVRFLSGARHARWIVLVSWADTEIKRATPSTLHGSEVMPSSRHRYHHPGDR